MPLVRVEVRNEYGLGAPELHADANKEDPKAVLEGVAVAGLVGILRQLGDLAEFAAEVFHGLQEEVMITSSRSHKLMGRVQRIEAALPPLEKLVLAQRSHLHFAYTAGANWHSRLRREQSHFIYSDLPRFIMDSYEHCRGPPHLNLLDKFDPGGPGSCLKRYSDPSFFRRASSGSDEAYVDKILKEKKHRKIKKKRSQKTGKVSCGASFSHNSSRLRFHSPKMDAQTSPSRTFTLYGELKSELGEQSVSLGSRYWSGDSDHISHPSYSMHHKEQEYKEAYSSPEKMHHEETNSFVFIDGTPSTLSGEQTGPTSFCVTWDGKLEILEPAAMEYDNEEIMGTFSMNFDRGIEESGAVSLISKECDNHENLETLPLTSHVETEDKGTCHFKTAEYDYDDTLESSSMNFDPKTQGRGTSLSIDAKEYDLDQTLDNLSMTFDLETQDREVAGQKHVHLDNEELSMPIFNDIQLGGSEGELVGQLSSQLKLENVPMLISGDVLHDEVESETDNYVDALNTIESEYETDVDGPTKQEVRQYSDSDNEAVDGGVDMLTTRQPGSHSSNSKTLGNTSSSPDNALQVDPSPMLSETCSGERVTSETVSKSLSLESCGFLQSPEIASKCLDSGSTPDVDTCNIVDELGSSNVNSVMSNISSGSAQQNLGVPVSDKMTSSYLEFQNLSPCKIFDDLGSSNVNSVTSNISSGSAQQNLGVPVRDKTTSSYLELQNPSSEHASVTSVMLWTNGGLLGLQPSKPPDFCMLNASSEVSVKSKDDTVGTSIPQPDIIEKKYKSVDGAAVGNFSTSSQDDSRTGIFMKKASWLFSSADLGVSLQKLSDAGNQSYADNSQQNGTNETNGTVHPVTPDIHSTKASQDNSSNSSRMFELGNRLLVNGFHRKPSLDKDDNLTSTSSPNAGIFEPKNSSQNVNKMLSGNKDMLRSGSPFVSPSSSPPLGHMKISFQPINGFEAQLQLKFPDGNVSRESSRDTFPSFQLVPEPTIPLHDAGSDSEDDTFCRSSPYESDCLSDQSDSNSEQWESDASPSGKDHELYDSLRRMSFTEAVPTTWDTGAVVQGEVINNYTQISLSRNSVEHSQSGHFFDLPSLDTLQTSMMDRNNYELRSFTESQCPKEPSPLPPPLPPPQWRTVKTQVDLAEDRQVAISENLSYSFDQKFGSTISQQPKPAPLKQEHIMEAAQTLKSKKLELQKTSRQKGVNRTVCQKEIEEKDDFLHQIRTKSFTLRRTVTEKPTVSTVPPTSVQVTAILKKATEIRQAVASDGEDDNWSDT